MDRIEEINARLCEIRSKLESPNVNADELEAEVKSLIEERADLREAQEKRQALLKQIAEESKLGTVAEPPKMPAPAVNLDSRAADRRSTMEYRNAFRAYVTADKDIDVKRAADQLEVSDLGVLLPMTIVQKVMTDLDKVYGYLYSRVKKTNIKGGVKYPIGAFSASFKRITENTVSERQAAGSVTGYVEFSYLIGEIRIARTLLQSILTVEAFEAEVAKVIVKAYVEAMDKEIMNGNPASNQMTGILTEAKKSTGSRIPADHIIEMTAADVADWTQWENKLFAEIPIAMEHESPEFVMAKQTYVSNLVTLKDTKGQPINKAGYDVSDRMHKFNEYPVHRVEKDILPDFNSAAAGDIFAMFWVPDKAYCINTNMEFVMIKYFDHETNQYVDKALVVNDGKILDPQYLYLLKKSSPKN